MVQACLSERVLVSDESDETFNLLLLGVCLSEECNVLGQSLVELFLIVTTELNKVIYICIHVALHDLLVVGFLARLRFHLVQDVIKYPVVQLHHLAFRVQVLYAENLLVALADKSLKRSPFSLNFSALS